ncbi:MAG TPA: PAS domain-containing sensor histidine kinase [Gemmatimonadaceae bacterium]|nr:PAS domain-containing sensor histidine kinase [Gemmatimonadaceae bacterium]
MTRSRALPQAYGGGPIGPRWSDGKVRCQLVTEYASDMISVHEVDEAATYLYVSPAAERLFGYTAEELTGRSVFEFIHPADRATIAMYAAKLRESADIATARYRFRVRSGAYEWVESTCRMVRDPLTLEPAEFVATTRSAEARVAIEMERERLLMEADGARAAAEAADRTKDEFLAMMSHEFRTPLNAIAGHVQLLTLGIHGPLTDAQRAALERVDGAQRFLLRLVNDVLRAVRAGEHHTVRTRGRRRARVSISRDLARGMGGELRVRGVEGAGASFTLSLPFVEPRQRADDARSSE